MPDGDVHPKNPSSRQREPREDVLDVLIVGAGLSGIGAACHLLDDRPTRHVLILEARDAVGGTWDLFRYPGIRSDSDMLTLGYRFRPWREHKPLADGPAILDYVRETARAHGVDRLVRLGHRVHRASWSSEDALWTVEAEHGGRTVCFRASFLLLCAGYYDYAEGHAPRFPGIETFEGRFVHPQFWPPDLDHAGKRVLVIGSGATAVTLVPAMAEDAAHVIMLQRSPTYVVSLPTRDPMARAIRRVLPERAATRAVRARNIMLSMYFYRAARAKPEAAKKRLIELARKQLPAGYDVATHFTPRYNPWDQRVCLVPDGNLFRAIRHGRVEMVTDTIERFIPDGVRLASGRELAADIVVSATGLKLVVFGSIRIEVDGRKVDPARTMSYKGMMLSGVPNAAFVIGYTNASWTLKADLVSKHLCRLLNFMRRRGYTHVTPERTDDVSETSFLDFTSGYVQRALSILPKQGDRAPWRLHQNYVRDLLLLRYGSVRNRALRFGREGARIR